MDENTFSSWGIVPGVILDRFKLTDHVGIVTGAGRGIGAATAVALAEAGANVVLAARTESDLQAVAEQVSAAGRRALVMPCDVNDLAALDGLVEAAVGEWGRLDIVVNNAGGAMPRAFLDTKEHHLEDTFHFNVTTAFALSKRAVPHLLRSDHGAIVNISSTMGRLRDRGFVAYGTAKAGLAHLTRLMAADLAPRVRVNAIACGSIATSALETVLQTDSLHDEMVSRTPLGRIGDPEDVAAAVVYLASLAGAYVTGKILEVDGGIEAPNLGLGLPDLAPPD